MVRHRRRLETGYAFGGVSANLHEHLTNASVVRFPATSDIGTVSVISSKSSLLSFTSSEPILLSRFFILVVPTTHKNYRNVNSQEKNNSYYELMIMMKGFLHMFRRLMIQKLLTNVTKILFQTNAIKEMIGTNPIWQECLTTTMTEVKIEDEHR